MIEALQTQEGYVQILNSVDAPARAYNCRNAGFSQWPYHIAQKQSRQKMVNFGAARAKELKRTVIVNIKSQYNTNKDQN